MQAMPIDTGDIVITASRVPETQAKSPASVTIIDQQRIERLGEPLVSDLLRLVPSAAVSVSGPAGSLTDVRIRGAEANHTLLFIDGIRANDPASGDQPRFDLLNADIASRIEVIRGPQSALWGSEAIGGVVAVNGTPEAAPGYAAGAEAGSFGFERANGSIVAVPGSARVAAAFGLQRATGIDSFNGHGDRDGYRNLSGRVRGSWAIAPHVSAGVAAFAISAYDEFDGFDPVTFRHADTLDNTRNHMIAGRFWTALGTEQSAWNAKFALSALQSSNHNFLAAEALNQTSGGRRTAEVQIEHRFSTGSVAQTIIAAGEAEHETFRARDSIYGGATDQDRSRDHSSLTLEWRATAPTWTADFAARHDFFNRFKDATNLRASVLGQLGGGWSVAGSYAEGISQPTFFDLYGFFPGSFVGNPSLKPESSRGFEVSGRYRGNRFTGALTLYRQRLHDEIIDTFDSTGLFSSTANRPGISNRSGVEAEASLELGTGVRLSAEYAYLRATEPDSAVGRQTAELRRPKHSGSVALDGVTGRLSYGASLAYEGRHLDRTDMPPYALVSLRSYWLANARLGYSLARGSEVFARISNALNRQHVDVYGYRTEPRGIFVGLRLTGR